MNEFVIAGAIIQLALMELKCFTFELGDDATVDDVYLECFRRAHPSRDVEEHRTTILADAKNWLRKELPEYVKPFVMGTRLVRALTT